MNFEVVRRKAAVFCLMTLSGTGVIHAEGPDPQPAAKIPAVCQRMFVEPSSTTVYLAKVNLIVNPLTHKGRFYLGDYQIKVMPYSFKNEQGRLLMEISDESFHKLTEGMPVEFKGKAINGKNGKQKVVIGKTTPADHDHGVATFSIVTDHGLMVFNTAYRLGE